MTRINTMPCPNCNQIITYDVYGLLTGLHFTCPGCAAVISISKESQPVLKNAIDKYEELEKKAGK